MKNRDGSMPNDHWATPKWLYDQLTEEFNFDFDPCPLNAKFDGLSIDWGKSNFINPPYNRVDKPLFIQKAFEQWRLGKTCVLLIPTATSTKQFHELILPNAEVRFLKGRVAFSGYNDKGIYTEKNKGKHDSMIVIFRAERSNLCHTLFTRNDFKDLSGCLKPSGHAGEHICKTYTGYIAWDYDFDCGCKDCQSENWDDMCIVYRDVKDINS